MRRRHDSRFSYFQVGAFTLLVIVVITYFGFTKAIPFKPHYEIKAAFKSSNNLRPNSFVRIAGVNVGKVTKVEHLEDGSEGAVVTMQIEDKGRPIHKDAEFMIRPRIFLEGNFFVDVKPGSPSEPELEDGDVIPAQQTATPVQLDQILTALQSDTREELKVVLDEFSKAVDAEGVGSTGYRRSIPYWEPAYKNSAIVNEASLGLLEHDLSQYIEHSGAVAESLTVDRQALKSLITGFNETASGFAREKTSLEAAIAELPRTLGAAEPALAKLNEAFPPLRRLVADLIPATESAGPALEAGTPLLDQLGKLTSEEELGGLVSDLEGAVPPLTKLNKRSVPLMQETRLASSCQNEVIVPWAKDKVPDAAFPAQGPVYQEGVQFLPGIAGESRSGDANGQWFRVLAAGGNYTLVDGPFIASLLFPIMGVNPPKPVDANGDLKRPVNRPDVPCETQERPDLRTIPGPPPAQRKSGALTGKAAERLADARKTAIQWLRGQLKYEGNTHMKVADRDVTLEEIKRLGQLKKAQDAAQAKRLRRTAR